MTPWTCLFIPRRYVYIILYLYNGILYNWCRYLDVNYFFPFISFLIHNPWQAAVLRKTSTTVFTMSTVQASYMSRKSQKDEISLLPSTTRFGWKHIRELTFFGDISTRFFCGFRCFLLVHCKTLVSYKSIVLTSTVDSIIFSKLSA